MNTTLPNFFIYLSSTNTMNKNTMMDEIQWITRLNPTINQIHK